MHRKDTSVQEQIADQVVKTLDYFDQIQLCVSLLEGKLYGLPCRMQASEESEGNQEEPHERVTLWALPCPTAVSMQPFRAPRR